MMALFVVLLPVILLFCGLSLDAGMLELKQAQLQSAADVAALGAVLEAERGTGRALSGRAVYFRARTIWESSRDKNYFAGTQVKLLNNYRYGSVGNPLRTQSALVE